MFTKFKLPENFTILILTVLYIYDYRTTEEYGFIQTEVTIIVSK